MASKIRNFLIGIGLIPNATDENSVKGDLNVLDSDGKVYSHNGTSSSALVTEKHASQGSARLENKDLDADSTNVVDGTDTSKKLDIDLSGATASTKTTIVSSQTANRSITLPDATDTLVGKDTSDVLTNKSIDGATNTLTNIPNASLDNDSITINGNTVALGGSTTVTASTTNALTIGNGLDGGSFDGSAPVTIEIDSSVVTLTDTQALSNKTLTSPVINTATVDTITGIAAGPLTLNSATGEDLILNGDNSLELQNAASTIATISSTGLDMASGKDITLSDNSQTVTLQASATASASYTITTPDAAPTPSTALVYNGTNFVWGQAGGWTTGEATGKTAGSSIAISTTAGQQVFRTSSNGGDITLSLTPFGTSAPTDGATIRLVGTSDANSVTIEYNDAAKGCIVKGNATIRLGDMIEFQYIANDDRFYEVDRNF